jgi:hypothetical protein
MKGDYEGSMRERETEVKEREAGTNIKLIAWCDIVV